MAHKQIGLLAWRPYRKTGLTLFVAEYKETLLGSDTGYGCLLDPVSCPVSFYFLFNVPEKLNEMLNLRPCTITRCRRKNKLYP